MTGVEAPGDSEWDATVQQLIGAADLQAAARAVEGAVARTPTIACPDLGQGSGAAVSLKAECLQLTGSFKLRGALSRVAALGASAERGLVTASAGNHARAVAEAARLRGVGCDVFMPRDATVSKVLAAEELGARVRLEGASVDDALEQALRLAEETGAAFVHPFDDIDVIAGQATLGMELLEDVPDLARVVVPVGGGGLASGIGIALRRAGSDALLVGVQAAACAPYVAALAGEPVQHSSAMTIADGVAVKQPGRLTLPLLRELLDDLIVAEEDQIADAMVFLAERAKLVAEGAGAIAVAALLSGRLAPVAGTTVAIVSGGNVDSGLFASLLLRHEAAEGRRVRIFTRVPDRPGGLAELLGLIATARANVVSVEHLREAVPLHVRETAVELTLETRGPGHTEEVLGVLAVGGYDARIG
ncbi:MAG: threonine dehydratase [Solirubrobacteraceae bacterium]|nr:threonine dehydratase [Solirubrobacteraceae bacterium]